MEEKDALLAIGTELTGLKAANAATIKPKSYFLSLFIERAGS